MEELRIEQEVRLVCLQLATDYIVSQAHLTFTSLNAKEIADEYYSYVMENKIYDESQLN